MSKKETLSVIKPVYEIGATVFSVLTLDKAVIYQRLYVEEIGQESGWSYRLQVGEQGGQPMITKETFAADQLCIKARAEEILKQKEVDLQD